jgi:hypothetical protein
MSPSPSPAPLNAGQPSRSPEGTAMLAAFSRSHIARRAGLGAARRSARKTHDVSQQIAMDT